ncbi:hypothetical protein CEXT_47861 [Caerostris extrusa]|uniref:Uncharacterized protein n=1 Tax=Caerostris extrusa TaxID=172846 RepID=A0AAV4T893_CAEEX|nr:hypothetical protein CEXT_47861 [Caerostris extrusa]
MQRQLPVFHQTISPPAKLTNVAQPCNNNLDCADIIADLIKLVNSGLAATILIASLLSVEVVCLTCFNLPLKKSRIKMSDVLNPRQFLKTLLGKKVGLEDVTDKKNGKRSSTVMAIVLVRCNNILYIQELTEEREEQESNSGEGGHVTEM